VSSQKKLKALYTRIGGRSALAAILEDFYQRMAKDILIGFYFDKKDPLLIASKQLEFLLKAMGVEKTYLGKTPGKAHGDLPPILQGHFDRRLVLLEETLRDHHLTEEEIQTWIHFERSFSGVIVKRP